MTSLFTLLLFFQNMSPGIGGFIGETIGWRWALRIVSFQAPIVLVILFFIMPETALVELNREKAKRLNKQYQTDKYHTKRSKITVKKYIQVYVSKPIRILLSGPVVVLVAAFQALVFATLYGALIAIPFIFGDGGHNFGTGVEYLPQLAIATGASVYLMACVPIMKFSQIIQNRILHVTEDQFPERFFVPTMFSAMLLPIGYFYYGWTSNPKILWVVPLFAGIPLGFAIVSVLVASSLYMLNLYKADATSVFATLNMLRTGIGVAFPLFLPPLLNSKSQIICTFF